MLTNFLQTAITVVDTLMIGQLGAIPIAAAGLGNILRFFLLITVLSVSVGAMSLVAQAKGNRDRVRLSFVTRQGILSGLILSVILAVLGVSLAEPMLTLMNQGGESEAVHLGTQYVRVLFLGTPFLILNFVCNRIMQGAGDMITPLILTGIIFLLNILLSYLFIFGIGPFPALGIVGASWGTIISRALVVGFTLWLFHSGRNVVHLLPGNWCPDIPMMRDILSIGIPSGIQGLFRHASNFIVVGLVTASSLGTLGAAVLAIGTQVEQLLIQTIVGLNVAATSMVGQEIGRWQTQEAYRKGLQLGFLGVGFISISLIPAWIFRREIIALFDPSLNPLIVEGGLSYFALTLWALPFSSLGVIFSGAMRGAGDTRPPMYSAMLNRSLLQLLIGWVLAFPLNWGYPGIWVGLAAGRILDSIFMWVVWNQRQWKWKALYKTPIYRRFLQYLSPDELDRFLSTVRSLQMGKAGTQEILEEDRVKYVGPQGTTLIYFEGSSYRIQSQK